MDEVKDRADSEWLRATERMNAEAIEQMRARFGCYDRGRSLCAALCHDACPGGRYTGSSAPRIVGCRS